VPQVEDAGPALTPSAGLLSIDPRIRLLVEVGLQARLGQVARAMRSDVRLDVQRESSNGDYVLVDEVYVASSGNKRTAPIILHEVSRNALRTAMRQGYLRELETAYARGDIEDYALFPQGRLIRGAAAVSKPESFLPATRDALRKWFHGLERAAGVEPVKGRAWYGLRRLTMDQAPEETANEVTLNTLSSTSTAMRNTRYQDRESEVAALEAAGVAERIRTRHRVGGATPQPPADALCPAAAAQLARLRSLPVEKLARLLALLDAEESGASGTAADGPFRSVAPARRPRGRPRNDGSPPGSPRENQEPL
jgi:hypothetical protein